MTSGSATRAAAARCRSRNRGGSPWVSTCYATSARDVLDDAARHAGAYVYLVAHYGRSGTAPAAGYAGLGPVVSGLHAARPGMPVAVGFGVRTAADVTAVAATGADAVVVGSAAVSHVEHAQTSGHDVVAALSRHLRTLRAVTTRSPS